MRQAFRIAAIACAGIVGAVVLFGLVVPSRQYLYVPDEARSLAPSVTIKDRDDPSDDVGGIYVVDVTIKRARWADRLLPFLRPDGAELVPKRAVTPDGQSFADRRRRAQAQMERSQATATAVALEEAGYDVDVTPNGVLVTGVAPDVPAANVLEEGDVIVAAGGRPTLTPAELRAAVGRVAPGAPIALRFERAGKTVERVVTTVEAPDDPSRPIIGIAIAQEADIGLPLEVEIDLGDVGGPSAGLPFALEVLQKLGRDVDRGYRVAATGEIELDGSVGPVGGLKQKTYGVRAADADVFLVPAGENARVARRYAGNLRVIPVRSFQQALRILKTLPKK